MSELGMDLKKSQEARLIQLFQTKCDENGGMDLSHFIELVTERGMVSNRFGLEVFYAAFRAACADEFDKPSKKGNRNPLMDNNKFFYAIVLLSKILCHHEQNPFESMFSNILVDKLSAGGSQAIMGRLPKSDQETIDAVRAIYSP